MKTTKERKQEKDNNLKMSKYIYKEVRKNNIKQKKAVYFKNEP